MLLAALALPAQAQLPSGSSLQVSAAQALVARVVPDAADQFVLETIPHADSLDVFEVESRDG
jgi:hypothetical protein